MSKKLTYIVLLTLIATAIGDDKSDKDKQGESHSWSPCSKTCGIGKTQRYKNCSHGSCNKDNHKQPKTKPCMIQPCQVTCPPQFKRVDWPRTPIRETAVSQCPDGTIGNATRYCAAKSNSTQNDTKPVWEEVDTSKCDFNTSKYITSNWEKVDKIKGCSKMKKLSDFCRITTSVLLDDLYKESRKEVKSQDLKVAVHALEAVAAFSKHKDSKHFMDKGNSEKIIKTASNLLEMRNSRSWLELRKENNSHAAETLVKTMDSIGLIIANTSNTNTTVILAKNLALETKKIYPNAELVSDGVSFTHNQSSIYLPVELFNTNEQSVVVNIIYLTLGDILQLPVDYSDPSRTAEEDIVNVGSTIVSTTVTPKNEIKKSAVKIVLQNKRTLAKLNVSSAVCVSWSPDTSYGAWSDYGCQLVPGESDTEKTTCSCSHLTLFATFMDPHRIPLSRSHKFVLDFISCIGCSISLFSIAATMGVILSNWKRLKSPRIEVLLNICASIGIVCFLVLVEQPTRQNKVLCKLMAVLLHYFLLTAFAWMFCEGILLYIVLVRVDMTGGVTHSCKKPLYLLGWGFPLLILLISLWATELNGYGDSSYVCWLSTENGVAWAFIAPALVVIVANLMVLMKIIIRLQNSQRIRNCSLKEQVKSGTRAAAATMPLLGVTWLFGMLTFHTNLTVFKYLFTICNSLQGVFIFVFHCLFDRQVRKVFWPVRRLKGRRTRPQPPIQMKPYEAYVINTVQEQNRYKERRKACIGIS